MSSTHHRGKRSVGFHAVRGPAFPRTHLRSKQGTPRGCAKTKMQIRTAGPRNQVTCAARLSYYWFVGECMIVCPRAKRILVKRPGGGAANLCAGVKDNELIVTKKYTPRQPQCRRAREPPRLVSVYDYTSVTVLLTLTRFIFVDRVFSTWTAHTRPLHALEWAGRSSNMREQEVFPSKVLRPKGPAAPTLTHRLLKSHVLATREAVNRP